MSSVLLQKEEAEEVEPYASYVQRVNSIYNSSADLFAWTCAHAAHTKAHGRFFFFLVKPEAVKLRCEVE